MRTQLEFDKFLLQSSLNSAKTATNPDVAQIFREQAQRLKKRIEAQEKEQAKVAASNNSKKKVPKRKGKK